MCAGATRVIANSDETQHRALPPPRIESVHARPEPSTRPTVGSRPHAETTYPLPLPHTRALPSSCWFGFSKSSPTDQPPMPHTHTCDWIAAARRRPPRASTPLLSATYAVVAKSSRVSPSRSASPLSRVVPQPHSRSRPCRVGAPPPPQLRVCSCVAHLRVTGLRRERSQRSRLDKAPAESATGASVARSVRRLASRGLRAWPPPRLPRSAASSGTCSARAVRRSAAEARCRA